MAKTRVVIPYDAKILARIQAQSEAIQLTLEQRAAKANLLRSLDAIDKRLGIKAARSEKEPGSDQASMEAMALAVLTDHPDWPDVKIAKAAGCHRTTLYTFQKFRKARELLREGKCNLPRGSKFPDRGIEAWDNEGGG